MTFEERTDYFQIDIAEESASRRVLVDAQKVVYADWKAEREKLIGALAETTVMLKVLHGTNNKPKCADVKCAYCLRADTNRAVLAEVKGGE